MYLRDPCLCKKTWDADGDYRSNSRPIDLLGQVENHHLSRVGFLKKVPISSTLELQLHKAPLCLARRAHLKCWFYRREQEETLV